LREAVFSAVKIGEKVLDGPLTVHQIVALALAGARLERLDLPVGTVAEKPGIELTVNRAQNL
jgi:hypothetical protein